MSPVVSQILILVMIVAISTLSYAFFKGALFKTQSSAEKTTMEIISSVEENIEVTSINRRNITILNKGGPIKIARISLDDRSLNFSPDLLENQSLYEVTTNVIIYDPISKIKVGNALKIYSFSGNVWEFSIPGEKVDKILTLQNFSVINGNWTENTYIHGEV